MWPSQASPPGTRQLTHVRSQVTREHILRAGRDAFCTLGYESTTFKEIAERANVSRPTVNYHFASKDALYRAVEQDALTTVLADTVAQPATECTFFGQLHAFATSLVSGESENRSRADFLITSILESARNPGLRAAGTATTTALREHLADMANAAMDRGELPTDTDVAAMVEFALVTLLGIGLCAPARRLTAGRSSSIRRQRRPTAGLADQPRRRTA